MYRQFNIRQILMNNPLIPVVTFNDLNEVDDVVKHLIKNNINCIEITLRTSISIDALSYVVEKYKDNITIGVGTIINTNQIHKCKELGVDFMVSPGFTSDLINSFNKAEIPFLPGISSVNDILLAKQFDCQTLKFFPAELCGGIKMLKQFQILFPRVKFCPTGGIGLNNYNNYLELENVISVGGSWLMK